MLSEDGAAKERIARQEQRCRDIRVVLDDADSGRRPMAAALRLIAEIALGEADRTVRVGDTTHKPEIQT